MSSSRKGYLFEWDTDMKKSFTPRGQAYFVASTYTSFHIWHARLGHRQPHIAKACVSSFNLPVNHVESFTFCNSFLCNKGHCIPFSNN